VNRAGLALLTVAAGAGMAQADVFRPSVKDQINMGKQFSKEIAKEEKVLPESDPRVQELRRLGQALIAKIPSEEFKRRPFEYTFNVIESKELNAFAVPGGPIYFYTGLLDKMTTEDQVAGVLAHEIIHIRNQHWASAYADNLKRRMLLSLGLSIFRANETLFTVADLVDTFRFGLPYSRKHETEADVQGFRMVVDGGHNPQGMVDFMKILRSESKSKVQEWMSTHPDTNRRVRVLEDLVAKSGRSFNPQIARSAAVLAKPK
jgi:predicted Zn-dependent protease